MVKKNDYRDTKIVIIKLMSLNCNISMIIQLAS